MINELNRKTILLVTHNTAIANMAHRVTRLRSGEVVEDRRNESPIDPQDLRW
jgi:putative ABC transport system ATP-binding protein